VKPRRIQLSRAKGYRKPKGAIVVGRPSKYGNPYKVVPSSSRVEAVSGWWHVETWDGPNRGYPRSVSYSTKAEAAECAVAWFKGDIGPRAMHRWTEDEIRADLAGHDLACWCPPTDEDGQDFPCHATVLLEIANKEAECPA
jgi:hypothetical protein